MTRDKGTRQEARRQGDAALSPCLLPCFLPCLPPCLLPCLLPCLPRPSQVHFPPMRLLLAGILHLALASVVLAQANGDIESLGFEFNYRPGCWTPMVVRLTPTSGATFK